jgi:hypothetical protein
VLELSPKGRNDDLSDRLIASLLTRYLFELVANIGAILNAETPEIRIKRLESWAALREMAVHSDGTYSIPLAALGRGAKERLEKRGGKVAELPSSVSHESSEFISVEDRAFRFDDPWKLSMSKKVEYLPLKSATYFLDRWKMYSHISHASAFSIWPKWMDPIPRFDAAQCLLILAKCIAGFLGVSFDVENKFLKELCQDMIYVKPETRSQQSTATDA